MVRFIFLFAGPFFITDFAKEFPLEYNVKSSSEEVLECVTIFSTNGFNVVITNVSFIKTSNGFFQFFIEICKDFCQCNFTNFVVLITHLSYQNISMLCFVPKYFKLSSFKGFEV